MRKILLLCFLASFLLLFNGCSLVSFDTGIKIVAPKNNSVPLEGKWKVIKCLKKENTSLVPFTKSPWIGREAEFSANSAMLGSDYWVDPSYKIKSVNSEEYFLFSFGLPFEKLNLKDNAINVITLTNEDKFLYDFIKMKDDSVIVLMEDNLLFLKKTANVADKDFDTLALNKSRGKTNNGSPTADDKNNKSGIILGIRSLKASEDEGTFPQYIYKTLWIAADNKILHPIFETNGILVPRMNGFWKISTERITNGLRDENVFSAFRFPQTSPNKQDMPVLTTNLWGKSPASINNILDYVGNDFISVETTAFSKFSYDNESGTDSRLWLVPIDSIAKPRGVKISDIAGAGGDSALSGAKSTLLQSTEMKSTQEKNKDIESENFGISRKNGHWIFNGRYDYLKGSKAMFTDFKINLIPPSSVVYFDSLYVTWTCIKDKVPEAIDAFTSPRKDIALIRTNQRLYVYAINNGILGDSPLKKIKLQTGDMIIMAEWAGGKYVQKWENVLKADNAVVID